MFLKDIVDWSTPQQHQDRKIAFLKKIPQLSPLEFQLYLTMLKVLKIYLISTLISIGIFSLLYIFNGFKSSSIIFESMMFLVMVFLVKQFLDKHRQFRGIFVYRKKWDKYFVLINFLNLLVLSLFFIPMVISHGEMNDAVFFGFEIIHILPLILMISFLNTSKLRETILFRKNTVKFGLDKYSYTIEYKEMAKFQMTNNSISFQVGDKNFSFELIHHKTELIDEVLKAVNLPYQKTQ